MESSLGSAVSWDEGVYVNIKIASVKVSGNKRYAEQ